MSDALIVFAKAPVPGRVKTRLQSLLSPSEAARLYEAFLADSLDQYRSLGCDILLYLSSEASGLSDTIDLTGIDVRPQVGSTLAERLQHAFVEAFSRGYERLVVIGTDHPSLPTAFVERALEELALPASIVIGPAEDGGYYLLGMNDFYPVLFEKMTFSHSRVFDETMERAYSTRASVIVLPVWYDIDTVDQLERLREDLNQSSDHAPRSLRVLDDLLSAYGEGGA